MLKAVIFLALASFLSFPTHAQVPPPPLFTGQEDLARQLVSAIEHKDLSLYASLLADDLRVFEDGKEVASNKPAWLAKFGKKLTTDGVVFSIESVYASTGRLLFIEYFNSAGSWGQQSPSDCCWSNDAVLYQISNEKIHVIHRLIGGDKILVPAKTET